MNRVLIAAGISGAGIFLGGGTAAHASGSAYPPVQPHGGSRTVPAHRAPAPAAPTHQAPPAKTMGGVQPGALPRTGAEWAATAAIGGGLVTGGTGLVVAARRRRTP